LRPLNNEWINPAWSCHAETLLLFGSSWKRIRINPESGWLAIFLLSFRASIWKSKQGQGRAENTAWLYLAGRFQPDRIRLESLYLLSFQAMPIPGENFHR
jgi:hypothetical protein